MNKSKSVPSYNTTSVIEEIHQPGGTLSMTINSLTTSVLKWGHDEELGRWSWLTIRGKIIYIQA